MHSTDFIGFHDGFQTRSTTGVNYHFQGNDEIYQVEYLRGDTHSNFFKFHKKKDQSLEGFHQLDLKAEQDTISLTSEISTFNLKRTMSEPQSEQAESPVHTVYLINPTKAVENDTFRISFFNGVLYWTHSKSYAGFNSGFKTVNTTGSYYRFIGNDDIYQMEYICDDTPSDFFKYLKKEIQSLDGFHQHVLATGTNTIILPSEISTLRLRRVPPQNI
ncbi:hypothetical protein ACTFIR_005960 [Dictyostelium discoideum]